MTKEEAEAFEALPSFAALLAMRDWDDKAKVEHQCFLMKKMIPFPSNFCLQSYSRICVNFPRTPPFLWRVWNRGRKWLDNLWPRYVVNVQPVHAIRKLRKRNPNEKPVVDRDRARSRTVDAKIQQSIRFEYISSQKQGATTSTVNPGPFLILVAAETVHEIKKSP